MNEREKLLDIKDISIAFNNKQVVHRVSFSINSGEVLAVVGESGSGKSVTALQIMGLLPRKISSITSGSIFFNGKEITNYTEKEFQTLRGKDVAMVFQEPMSALNPSMKCGKQIAEVFKQHTNLSNTKIKIAVLELLKKVKLPDPERAYNAYPHELSGGQKQRIVIAMAIAVKPKLLIADEPTTALDAHVQTEIIVLLKELQQDYGMGLLFISHDLDVVASIADKIGVMYSGKIVEYNNTKTILNTPSQNYTKALLAAKPSTKERLYRLPTVQDFESEDFVHQIISQEEREASHQKIYASTPILRIESITKLFSFNAKGKKQELKAVDNVSLNIFEGETYGLVGESGCGKSTLGNLIMNLIPPTSGDILYRGTSILNLSSAEKKQFRKEVQLIFQDPFASLNPRKRIGNMLQEVLKVHRIGKNLNERKLTIVQLLKDVGLNEEAYRKYPHEFSGGQRQRINIARAIILQPKVIICDESVSALDISVQAQVLNLLNFLKEKYLFTYLFVSHDLSVVKYISDRVAVMQSGKIIEENESDYLFKNPKESYTRSLLAKLKTLIN